MFWPDMSQILSYFELTKNSYQTHNKARILQKLSILFFLLFFTEIFVSSVSGVSEAGLYEDRSLAADMMQTYFRALPPGF